ncbi:TPA: hypothetical protein ACP321_005335 [Pseudomonas aeruginosa]
MNVLFEMREGFRKSLINQHLFYMEEARRRLLSQFEDLNGEAAAAEQSWIKENSSKFDPDRDDAGSFYEESAEAGRECYRLLSDMREQTCLSVAAGIFHEWDKQLRQWVAQEVKRSGFGEAVVAKIWSVNFRDIADLLESISYKVRDKKYFNRLDALRCVVNVYKHGNGNSLKELEKSHPQYILSPYLKGSKVARVDYTYVKVSDEQLKEFSEAIVDFWKGLPELISAGDTTSFPRWFEKAG